MSLFRKELRLLIKPFVFWSLGLCVLLIADMSSYHSITSVEGAKTMEMLSKMPKVFLAVFGMSNLNVSTVGGYLAVLQNYAIICTAVFSVWLGFNAVSRESVDKTSEFLFTRPITRKRILVTKLIVAKLCLILFCAVNVLASLLSLSIYSIPNTVTVTILLYGVVNLLVGALFISITAFACTLFSRHSIGSLIGYMSFASFYALSVVCDMTESHWLCYLTPFKAFNTDLLLQGSIEWYVILGVCVVCACLVLCSVKVFDKKNLTV